MSLVFLASAASSALLAWVWTLLLLGRSVPWQATRDWVLLFALVFFGSAALWGRNWQATASCEDAQRRRQAAILVLGGVSATSVPVLLAAHLIEGFYGLLFHPFFRLQVLASAVAVTVLLDTLFVASSTWCWRDVPGLGSALRHAVTSRSSAIGLLSLLAVGATEAAAGSTPIGDDLGQYTEVALAFLDGARYPMHPTGAKYAAAGVAPYYLSMPGLPVLLGISFTLVGRILPAVAIVLALVETVFPVLMYLACLHLAGSRIFAFVISLLLFMFPVYQLHVLGSPEPDTLFVDLLLLAVVLGVRAARTAKWPYWAGLGLATALAANVRHEGLVFSVGALLVFVTLRRPRNRLLIASAVAPYLAGLLPLAIASFTLVGSPWPVHPGAVSPLNAKANLGLINEHALPWLSQAIGLPALALTIAFASALLGSLPSAMLLWNRARPFVFVPLLGGGYIAAALFVHPRVLNPYSPVDLVRHMSSGIPYLALGLAFALRACLDHHLRPLPGRLALAAVILGLLGVVGLTYYEAERLARPERHFGGDASLLWNGSRYLLIDVINRPVPVPSLQAAQSGEEARRYQAAQLDEYDLRRTNKGDVYHWTSLILGLLGLTYSAAPALLAVARAEPAPPRSARLGMNPV